MPNLTLILTAPTKKDRKRIQLTNSSPNEWVWEDIDWGDKSVVYSSRGTAEQMQRQGRIEWKDDSGGKRLAKDADFKEEQHPRDNDGKFSSGGSSSAKSPKEKKEPKEKKAAKTKPADPQTYHDVKEGKYGKGWMITPSGGMVDVTDEFGGGTNDHVGIFMLPERFGDFNISDKEAAKAVSVMKKMKRYEMLSEKTGDSKYDDKIYDLLDDFTVATSNLMMAAMKKGAVRVRQHSELSDFVSIQGEGLTLDRFRKLVQSQKIPFGRHLKYEIEGLEGEDKHHIYSVEAKWSVLSDAKSWPEVKRRMTAKDRAFNAGPENKS